MTANNQEDGRMQEDLLRCHYAAAVLDVIMMVCAFAAFVFSISMLVFFTAFPSTTTPWAVFWVAMIAVQLVNGVMIGRRYRWAVTWRTVTLHRRKT